MTERVTISEAAERLGVSPDTIRRRLRAGELAAEKVKTAQGLAWRVELPPDALPAPPDVIAVVDAAADAVELARLRERVAGLERLAEELQSERDAWREQAVRDGDAARELRILLRQAQALSQALPANVEPANGSGDAKTPDAPQTRQEAPAAGVSSFAAAAAEPRSWLAAVWQRLRGQ